MIAGKYFSFTSASVSAGMDLIARAETLAGVSNIVAKKLTLIASDTVTINVNSAGSSTLFQDTDGYFKLSLDSNDIMVSSLIVAQSTASPVFLAMVY